MHMRTYLLIDNVERRLVDETDVQALLPAAEDGIPRTVEHVSERDDVSGGTLGDDLVLRFDHLNCALWGCGKELENGEGRIMALYTLA